MSNERSPRGLCSTTIGTSGDMGRSFAWVGGAGSAETRNSEVAYRLALD